MTAAALADILGLFEATYDVKFLPARVRAYKAALADVGDDAGRRAAGAAVRSLVRVPLPADLIRLAEETAPLPTPSRLQDALPAETMTDEQRGANLKRLREEAHRIGTAAAMKRRQRRRG
jgi:hypothetical protein